jgi:hypothetical protein
MMYIRLCVMSIYNCQKRNAEAQLRRRKNPAYRIQEQVRIAHTNRRIEHRSKSLILHTDKLHTQTRRTEHRSKLLIQHEDKMHAQIRRTEHRSKLLILHKEDWQEGE